MHVLESELKTIFTDSGLVTSEDFEKAKEEAKRAGREITDVLIGNNVLSEEYVRDYLAGFFKVPTADLEKTEIDPKVLEMIPENFAKSRGVVVYAFDEKERTAKVGMLDPGDLATIEFLAAKLNAWIDIAMITPKNLRHAINLYKKKFGETFNQIIQENTQKALTETGVADASKLAEAVPIITILDSIIENAATLNASDLHFEPFEDKFLVRYRIDGIMHEIVSMPKEIGPIIVARVKVIASLQIDVHNAPQDGRFRFVLGAQYIDVRVSILPTFYGEKAEMRLLQGSARPLSLTELGLSEKDLDFVRDAIKRPHGMFLVTGPTGSGKTTTLYSVLHILNTPEVSVNTIEDPIEYNIPGITQTQVNAKAGVTFANGLRALVRQNPNIIMIGEIRDSETADIAVNAALTGHLVLSTLHTNDAATAVPRLIDIQVASFLIASTLDIIMAQRLVRKICPSCIQSSAAGPEVRRSIEAEAKVLGVQTPSVPKLVFKGKGCRLCGHTGYHGQIGIFEVLAVSEDIRTLILQKVPTNEIKKKAIGEGMTTMFEDGLKKVESGVTTLDEVLRVVRE